MVSVLFTMVTYGVRFPKFIWAPCAQMNSLAYPATPAPAFGLIYEGVVGQPR
jgi:hypothetical protein